MRPHLTPQNLSRDPSKLQFRESRKLRSRGDESYLERFGPFLDLETYRHCDARHIRYLSPSTSRLARNLLPNK
jgi:hypothetical protein